MVFFDGGYEAEAGGQLREALLFSSFGEALVHVRPLVVLALGGVKEVLRRVADAVQFLEPHLGVFLLVFSGLGKERGDLLVALFFGHGSKVGVLVARLRFAGEGGFEVLFRLRAGVAVGLQTGQTGVSPSGTENTWPQTLHL